jgi:hypothetical protein
MARTNVFKAKIVAPPARATNLFRGKNVFFFLEKKLLLFNFFHILMQINIDKGLKYSYLIGIGLVLNVF